MSLLSDPPGPFHTASPLHLGNNFTFDKKSLSSMNDARKKLASSEGERRMKIDIPTTYPETCFLGSALMNNLGPAGEVELLIMFEPGTRAGLITLTKKEIEFRRLFWRRVGMLYAKEPEPPFSQQGAGYDRGEVKRCNPTIYPIMMRRQK